MNYPKTLTDWAQKVIDTITPFAIDTDKTFYPLQFPAKIKPEILIMGLNPGGNYQYKGDSKGKGQVHNAKWGFVNGRMTVSTLLNGNPYNEEFNTWKIYKGLSQLSIIKELLEKGDFCFMNYFYLNTHHFTETESEYMSKIKELCKQLTYEFIQLIHPKKILVLGTANGFDQIQGIQNSKTILNGQRKRLLIRGDYVVENGSNIPIYGIPHPSYPFGNLQEVEALNKNIQELWEGKEELTRFTFEKDSYQFDINQLNIHLPKSLHFKRYKDCYDLILRGNKDNLLIRIVEQKRDKYIAYGTTMSTHNKLGNRSYKFLKGAEHYLQLIKEPREIKTERWLATQDFRFGCQHTNDYIKLANTVQALNKKIIHVL